MSDLGTLPGGSNSDALGINNSGEVVGYSDVSGGATHAFLYSSKSKTMKDISAVIGGSANFAFSVNTHGDIVGYLTASDGLQHAFLYIHGSAQATDLGALIGNVNSYAFRINNAGQIMIDSDIGPFLYSNGQLTQLVSSPGFSGSASYLSAEGINDYGQVAGDWTVCCPFEGFLYSVGSTTNLDSLGLSVSSLAAWDVNDFGQIPLWAGEEYLLTPTGPSLAFPLKGTAHEQVSSPLPTAYSAPINSVFDHHMKHPYLGDGTVTSFTNETGAKAAGVKPNTTCYGQGGTPFSITGNYTNGSYLCYDDHPGYDYRAGEDTEVYATASGTIYYPTDMVGIPTNPPAQGPYDLYHVLELIPDAFPNLKVYHLHLSTHPACLSGTPPPGADCFTGQPVAVPNPAPGCPTVLPPPATGADGSPTHVEAGCLIAYVGHSGPKKDELKAHLHFEVQQVMPQNPTLNAAGLQCRAPEGPIGMACVPVDPYGWYPLAGTSTDPYTTLLGVQNTRLW